MDAYIEKAIIQFDQKKYEDALKRCSGPTMCPTLLPMPISGWAVVTRRWAIKN
jgi:hypothetical protein